MKPCNIKLNSTAAWVLSISFVIYGIHAIALAYHTQVIFDDRIPWDAYFSFDNRSIILSGGTVERHPFSYYIFTPLKETVFYLSGGEYNFIFRAIYGCFCAFCISLHLAILFLVLQRVFLNVPLQWLVGLVVVYAFFSNTILLSFTPENYTISLLVWTFFLYGFTLLTSSQNYLKILLFFFVFLILMGGITLTNLSKILVGFFLFKFLLFQKKLGIKSIFSNWKQIFILFFQAIIGVVLFAVLYLWRLNFNWTKTLSKSEEQLERFSQHNAHSWGEMMYSWFFSGGFLFPAFVEKKKVFRGFTYQSIYYDVFQFVWQHLLIFIALIIVIWGIFKGRKLWVVQLSFAALVIDGIIHGVLRFGLGTAYIYAAHWIVLIPLAVAAFLNFSQRTQWLKLLLISVGIGIICNNVFRMIDFWEFALKFHPA